MRGNAKHYRNHAENGDKHLKKLLKARNKYQNILRSIEKEINQCQKQVKRDMHCLGVVSADSEFSHIPE